MSDNTLEPQNSDGDGDKPESKTFQLNIRITKELEGKIRAKAKASGRSMTAQVLRMLERAEQLDDMLGTRADGAFDLAIAFASGGPRSVVRELLERHGVKPTDLALWPISGNAAGSFTVSTNE